MADKKTIPIKILLDPQTFNLLLEVGYKTGIGKNKSGKTVATKLIGLAIQEFINKAPTIE